MGPEAYWDLIDTQQACRIIARETKTAIQVNLDKATGSAQPVAMLEELLKAVEGPLANMKNNETRKLQIGTVYPPRNISGELDQSAASEVLHTDALVCEDSTKHNMPLCRSPTVYKKYCDVTERASSEAAEECIGIPNEARA